jgi:hypothetical protein
MSDWQVGDLAVCVDAKPHPDNDAARNVSLSQLSEGKTYRVTGLAKVDGIFLAGVTAAYEREGYGWRSSRFRKIAPDKHEACEDEFVTLLKREKVNA